MRRVLFLLLFSTVFVFAADDPASVNTFVDVLLGLLQGRVGYIFIAIVLGFSAFFAWRNGNITPLIWGVVAALILGAAPYIGPHIVSWGNSTFGS
ncbi:TrbC/VirB2 family protein [Caminibacter sp.]